MKFQLYREGNVFLFFILFIHWTVICGQRIPFYLISLFSEIMLNLEHQTSLFQLLFNFRKFSGVLREENRSLIVLFFFFFSFLFFFNCLKGVDVHRKDFRKLWKPWSNLENTIPTTCFRKSWAMLSISLP